VIIGDGRKTVDQFQIKERFKQLEIDVDWKPLDRLTDYRNAIEHYHFTGRREELSEGLAGSARIIRQLIIEILGGDPLVWLGRECWEILLETEWVFEAELAASRDTLAPLEWYSGSVAAKLDELCCPACGSTLLAQRDPKNTVQQDAEFLCRSCGAAHSSEQVIGNAIGQILYADFYIAMTDGGEDPVVECGNCLADTFIVEEGLCAACGDSLPIYHCGECEVEVSEADFERHDGRCIPCFLASEMSG
jgi:uncharacterized protein YbaR (Trm112 family)